MGTDTHTAGPYVCGRRVVVHGGLRCSVQGLVGALSEEVQGHDCPATVVQRPPLQKICGKMRIGRLPPLKLTHTHVLPIKLKS